MAVQNEVGAEEDDFFEKHLRRMLDAPSFTEKETTSRGTPWNFNNSAPAPPPSCSEASTRSSDGRGPGDGLGWSSGYFSSGRDQWNSPASSRPGAPPTSHARSLPAEQAMQRTRARDSYAVRDPDVRPPSPPRPTHGHSESESNRQQILNHSKEAVCQPSAKPFWAQPAQRMSLRPHGQAAVIPHGQQQQRGYQAQADRMNSEDAENLLAASFCGYSTAPQVQPSSSSRPGAKAKSKKAPKQVSRCLQCNQVAGDSSFDHTCPVCGAVVCAVCVDDFRLIISSYRCPGCGDEQANQEVLQNSAWLRNAFRSARIMYANIAKSWTNLLSSGEEETDSGGSRSDTTPASRQCGKGPAKPAGEGIYAGPPATRQGAASAQPKALPKRHGATPQHRTRMPVGWEEAVPQQKGEDVWHTMLQDL